MQVFVAGTWEDNKALPYIEHALTLGKFLAENKYDLACGPGTGIAKYVVNGYRKESSRGKVRYYLPSLDEMERVGENVGEGADEIIHTDYDYPMRNVYQIKQSDALILITGGEGSLEEAIVSLADYRIPVGVLRNSGSAANALFILLDLFPEWKDLLLIDSKVENLINHINRKLK